MILVSMVRVYSQPSQGGDSSLGGIFGNTHQSRQGLDYDDLLNQKRRDEQKYRSGSDPYGPNLKTSASEGFLDRVAPPPPSYPDNRLQDQLDHLSNALSGLQGSVAPDAYGEYSTEYGYSQSYPHSASDNPEAMGRKTWSAPSRDPFGVEELQKEMEKKFKRNPKELDDPLQRKSSYSGQSQGTGYQPSFGNGGSNTRVRRGGGNAAPPGMDREKYMQELEEQMQEQKKRKEREESEAGTDWWEKKKPTSHDFKVPHPNQNQDQNYSGGHASKHDKQPSHHRPDPAEARKRYEQELKEQMEAKKRVDDEIKHKERDEDEKLERRLREQQDKMKREFDEEVNRKKIKEEAKEKRQEELMKRQIELQKEMDQKKKEADEKRQSERKGSHRPRSRKPSAEPAEQPQGLNFRSDSPPIPTMRSNQGPGNAKNVEDQETSISKQNSRTGSPRVVVEQLQTMRQGLEKRQESLKGEDDFEAGGWDGLAEL